MNSKVLFCIVLAAYPILGFAKVEVMDFSSPEHESRYKRLVAELRCLVCQNQNIASSNADLAKDLRQQVYMRIQNGESDQDIVDFMVGRYGEFVLYKPPLSHRTLVLWVGPFALLILGIGVMVAMIRSRERGATVSADAVGRARDLLDKEHEEG